jgi:hypothetical protein
MTYKQNPKNPKNPRKPLNDIVITSKRYQERLLELGHFHEMLSRKYVKLGLNISPEHIPNLGHTSVKMTESYVDACLVDNFSKINKSSCLSMLKLFQCPERPSCNQFYPISASQFRHEYASLYFSFLKPSNTKRK